MKLSNDWFKEQRACAEGYEWVLKRGYDDAVKTIEKLMKIDRFDWANWTIARALDRKGKIKYAIYAAEQVLSIFEKKFPKDKRPREAIEAAKRVLKADTKENRAAAAYAAYAAADADAAAAADAAYAYAYADAAAASYAAYAAAAAASYAAYAAAAAADAADAAAAYADADAAAAAARNKMKEKIIQYGIKLLKEVSQRSWRDVKWIELEV